MRKTSVSDRIIFLITAHVAGIKIVSGMEQHSIIATVYFTVAFGTLILAGAMLLLFGFTLFEKPFFPVISSLIPISLSLGIVQDYFPAIVTPYLIFVIILYITSIYARFKASQNTASLVLAGLHGISGIILFVLPLVLFFSYNFSVRVLFVSLGGLVIGIQGALLAVSKLSLLNIDLNKILAFFPGMMLISTACFVAGLNID